MSLVKIYKPTTPARRKTSVVDYSKVLTGSGKPSVKKLLKRKKTTAGRNSTGKITIRHRGGGSKKIIRLVDYKKKFEEGFKVKSIEYDPNRSAFVALVIDIKTGEKSYVLHSKTMKVNERYGVNQELTPGNTIPLKKALVGNIVSQIELNPGQGSKIVRSAGTGATVTAKDEGYVTLKLPSGEIRKFMEECLCTLDKVGNEAHGLERIGKAGRVRNSGIRPTVRGKVMNPVDHPHGGGEARNSIGMAYPKTPWGKHALGVKTRNKKKSSNKLIVNRRKKNK